MYVECEMCGMKCDSGKSGVCDVMCVMMMPWRLESLTPVSDE